MSELPQRDLHRLRHLERELSGLRKRQNAVNTELDNIVLDIQELEREVAEIHAKRRSGG